MPSSRTIGRRPLLLGGLGLLSAALMPSRLWATPNFKSYPFSLGVASGDPLPDGFVIWTRLAPEPLARHGGMPMAAVEVKWEVATDARFSQVVQSGTVVARPELGHSCHVEVAGLLPSRVYFYRFLVAGSRSTVGRVRTAPPAGAPVDRARIAVVGCQMYETGYYTAYAHLAREPDIDVIYHYGDYIYEGKAGAGAGSETDPTRIMVRPHVGDEIYSLDDYRQRYSQTKMDRDLQAAHASAPFVVTYDDHEVDNDWIGGHGYEDVPADAFVLREIAALQAWYENMPVRMAQFPRRGAVKLFRHLDYGSLVRMHVLDTRAHRSLQLCNDWRKENCRLQETPDSTVLGREQEAWLGRGLDNKASWNLMAQQILFMPYDFREPGASKPRSNTDDWVGYPAARKRLIKSITDRKLSNVVIATGNSHRHLVGNVPVRDEALDGPMAAVEFMSTSISSGGDGVSEWAGMDHAMSLNPHFKMMNFQRGYQIFNITPKLWETDVKVMDFVEREGGSIRTLGKFAVTPDRAEVHTA
jgi:alkaline phosphatase D